jgi:hypothetical protein
VGIGQDLANFGVDPILILGEILIAFDIRKKAGVRLYSGGLQDCVILQ